MRKRLTKCLKRMIHQSGAGSTSPQTFEDEESHGRVPSSLKGYIKRKPTEPLSICQNYAVVTLLQSYFFFSFFFSFFLSFLLSFSFSFISRFKLRCKGR